MNLLQRLNFKWYPTHEDIEIAERRMLSNLKTKYEQKLVKVGDNEINTIVMGEDGKETLVLVHGFAAGLGFWTGSLDYLSQFYKVYAFDLPGFGRSSRIETSKTVTSKEEAEKFWTKAIYDWSEEMGLKKFNLLGHSLGGYLAGSFTIDYPDKVNKLILLDPWGLPEFNPNLEIPLAAKILSKVVTPGLGIIRLSGPKLITKVRSDLLNKFGDIHPIEPTDSTVNTVANYIYHSNCQTPATGEHLFKLLALPLGWAANPLKNRLKAINPNIDVTFIYGQNSWITSSPAFELKREMQNIKNIIIVPDSGHHIYIDNIPEFHASILQSIPIVESVILKEAITTREQLHCLNPQNLEFNKA